MQPLVLSNRISYVCTLHPSLELAFLKTSHLKRQFLNKGSLSKKLTTHNEMKYWKFKCMTALLFLFRSDIEEATLINRTLFLKKKWSWKWIVIVCMVFTVDNSTLRRLILVAKVLCKPHLVTGHCEAGKSKSARIGPNSNFQKHIHDRPTPRYRPIMDMPRYWMGFFQMEFAENLCQFWTQI